MSFGLSIVVPCYNEEENLIPLLDRFKEAIGDRDIILVLVDNGSTDSTEEILSRELPRYIFAKTVKVDVNQGYGYGILCGLKACDSDYMGWTHADLQTDPADVIKAYDMLDGTKKIFIKGHRKGRPFFDTFFTAGMSVYESILFRTSINDINAQPNIFHREFYRRWENPPHDFSLDLYVYYIAKRMGCRIRRFPVLFPEREHGHSKWNNGFKSKLKFIKRTITYSKELKREISSKSG